MPSPAVPSRGRRGRGALRSEAVARREVLAPMAPVVPSSADCLPLGVAQQTTARLEALVEPLTATLTAKVKADAGGSGGGLEAAMSKQPGPQPPGPL